MAALWHRKPRCETVILNIPVTAVLVYAVSLFALSGRGKVDAFRHSVANPPPAGLRVISSGHLSGIGEKYVAVEFELGQGDLMELLRRDQYVLATQVEGTLELDFFKKKMKETTGIDMQIELPYSHYLLPADGYVKHIFLSTNQATVYFFLSPGRDG
jgi:hypothetical protein